MTCWLKYLPDVKGYLRKYSVTEQDAKEILRDIESEVGHNALLIGKVVEQEKTALIRRLKRRRKEAEIAYN
jgi:selenophosphate synthetase-related protein